MEMNAASKQQPWLAACSTCSCILSAYSPGQSQRSGEGGSLQHRLLLVMKPDGRHGRFYMFVAQNRQILINIAPRFFGHACCMTLSFKHALTHPGKTLAVLLHFASTEAMLLCGILAATSRPQNGFKLNDVPPQLFEVCWIQLMYASLLAIAVFCALRTLDDSSRCSVQ